MQLYKKVPHGKTFRYEPVEVQPAPPVPAQEEFTNEELITLGASLGMMVLMQMEKHLPEKARIPRKLKAVRDAILDLVKGNGARIDTEMCDYWAGAWNRTMTLIQSEMTEAVEKHK
jgi:hypothetical protein